MVLQKIADIELFDEQLQHATWQTAMNIDTAGKACRVKQIISGMLDMLEAVTAWIATSLAKLCLDLRASRSSAFSALGRDPFVSQQKMFRMQLWIKTP